MGEAAVERLAGVERDAGGVLEKIVKMERAVEHLLAQHRYSDQQAEPAQWQAREQQIQTLNRAIEKVRGFLQGHQDKVGPSGRVKKSNITDNESAKMPS